MSEPDQVETNSHHGDFWSQVPVVLFTMAAVVALFVVNKGTQAEPSASVATPAAVEVNATPAVTPADCADCGEIIAIRRIAEGQEEPAEAAAPTVLLDVRMTDGTVRTVRQSSPGFEVGDRVQVNGDALVSRG